MLAKIKEKRPVVIYGSLLYLKSGALGEIRTLGLCLRRAALYPLSYKRVLYKMVHLVNITVHRYFVNISFSFGAEGGI